VVGSGRAAGASVYSTFILTESHKPHRIRQAKRVSAEEDHDLRVRGAFRNGMIFCNSGIPWHAIAFAKAPACPVERASLPAQDQLEACRTYQARSLTYLWLR